jgi:hypothetical protein
MSDRAAPPTVRSLHVLAEHVLGAGLHAATGHIGLQVAPGGFATPTSAVAALDGRFSVAHGVLVLDRPDGARQEAPISTVRSAAEFFGVAPGMPASVYQPSNELDLDGLLPIDVAVAERIGEWLALGDEALDRFAADHAGEQPGSRTLWPEHFDLGFSMAEVNYGVSPGDAVHAEPYLYVGPRTPRTGAFWNEPFGASVAASAIRSLADAVAFFEQGRTLAATPGKPADPAIDDRSDADDHA